MVSHSTLLLMLSTSRAGALQGPVAVKHCDVTYSLILSYICHSCDFLTFWNHPWPTSHIPLLVSWEWCKELPYVVPCLASQVGIPIPSNIQRSDGSAIPVCCGPACASHSIHLLVPCCLSKGGTIGLGLCHRAHASGIHVLCTYFVSLSDAVCCGLQRFIPVQGHDQVATVPATTSGSSSVAGCPATPPPSPLVRAMCCLV